MSYLLVVKDGGEMKMIIAKGAAEVNFTVSLSWKSGGSEKSG
jgi:hypothetical protein